MAVVGGYLLLTQVQVTTSFWNFGRYGGFGPSWPGRFPVCSPHD
jgi:hypothetical protein